MPVYSRDTSSRIAVAAIGAFRIVGLLALSQFLLLVTNSALHHFILSGKHPPLPGHNCLRAALLLGDVPLAARTTLFLHNDR